MNAAAAASVPALGVALPYSLDAVAFPVPALADAVAAARLDGDRELALATLMVARLMLGALPPAPLSIEERSHRAEHGRQWLSGLSMPQPARMALLRAMDASAAPEGGDGTAALRELAHMLTGHIPESAQRELVTLAGRLRLYYDER